MKATRFSAVPRLGILALMAALTFETAAVAQTKGTESSSKSAKSATDSGRTKRPDEVAGRPASGKAAGKRAASKSGLPTYSNVTIYSAQDIERSGAGTLDQFLRRTVSGGRR